MLLLLAIACIPVPAPDFRRPAALVVLDGGDTAGMNVRVCTWSTRHSPLDGCGDIKDGMPSPDGIGVPEWAPFPLVLGLESPMWGDAFVACKDGAPRGMMLRLPGIPVKWDETVHLTLDTVTKLGESKRVDVDAETASTLATRLCKGEQPVKED